ncbi:hypothetical protein EWM64_g4271 [Hericium alpestre]|uniref:Uncharacterized protein n=1 Tax=Hericium alpestre TaxID=135208 RepID=A0A4Y9ZY55_9AGAM|nr:hypothetical protein EWM64_g4271 [Hericium alpestre]
MRSRWALFKPFKRETITHSYLPKRLSIFDVYVGGLFAQAVSGPNFEDKIELISRVALPGRTRPLRDLGAVIPDITRKQETFIEQTFHFQPEINLVVFFERYSFSQLYSDSDDSEENDEEEDERTVIRMVFRTMSSGTVQPHPACQAPDGVIEFVHKDAREAYSHVHGDAFGVAFLVYELMEIVIWNWHSGECLMIFVVDITPTMDEDAPGLCLVVHGLAICKWGMWAFKMHRRNTGEAVDIFVPWEDWGPGYSRLFTVKPLTYIGNPPHRSIAGERIALQLRDNNGKDTAYVLDFNLRTHKRTLSASSNGSAAAIAFGSTTYISPGFFAAPVTTSLPYTEVEIPDHEQYYDFMLDEERLLCMKPGGIDVLVF